MDSHSLYPRLLVNARLSNASLLGFIKAGWPVGSRRVWSGSEDNNRYHLDTNESLHETAVKHGNGNMINTLLYNRDISISLDCNILYWQKPGIHIRHCMVVQRQRASLRGANPRPSGCIARPKSWCTSEIASILRASATPGISNFQHHHHCLTMQPRNGNALESL